MERCPHQNRAALNRQKGSTIVIVLVVIFVASLLTFNLLQSSTLAIPWKRKFDVFKATTLAENAILLKNYDDLRPKPPVDTLDGDSIIVGSKGYGPDTTLLNIADDMAYILMSSKEILPEVETDSSGMWITYTTSITIGTRILETSASYGQPLHSIFGKGLLITGSKPVMGVSDISITGGYSMSGGFDPEQQANVKNVSMMQGAINTFSEKKRVKLNDQMKEAFESEEDNFNTTSHYRSLSDFSGQIEVLIPAGDFAVSIPEDERGALPSLERIIVEGNVEIDGWFDMSNVIVLASGTITISGGVRGENVVFYSKEKIVCSDSTALQGTFVVEGDAVLEDNCQLIDNSLIITAGSINDYTQGEGAVYLNDESSVHGIILSTAKPRAPEGIAGSVLIGNDAAVTGVVYASAMVDNQSEIIGSVVARSMSCDGQEDCFGSGSIDRTALGEMFLPIDMIFKDAKKNRIRARWRQKWVQNE